MNIKWYFDENGVKVKKCALCQNPFPYTNQFFPQSKKGKLGAYCLPCEKVYRQRYSQRNKKTDRFILEIFHIFKMEYYSKSVMFVEMDFHTRKSILTL